MTREQYMGSPEGKHRAYYRQYAEVPGVKALVSRSISRTELLASSDPHFNDIPLMRWDCQVSRLPAAVARVMKENGDYLTVAGGVCILKEAARLIVEEQGA